MLDEAQDVVVVVVVGYSVDVLVYVWPPKTKVMHVVVPPFTTVEEDVFEVDELVVVLILFVVLVLVLEEPECGTGRHCENPEVRRVHRQS